MKSIRDENLAALYRSATQGLPNNADRRLTTDELVQLANGAHLGARHEDAMRGLADSTDQALTLQLLMQTRALSAQWAAEINDTRRPGLVDRLQAWWRSAGMPPVFASAGIALMAVIGFDMLGAGGPLPLPQTAQAPMEIPLFDGAFEAGDQMFAASLENDESPDEMFNGNFDS